MPLMLKSKFPKKSFKVAMTTNLSTIRSPTSPRLPLCMLCYIRARTLVSCSTGTSCSYDVPIVFLLSASATVSQSVEGMFFVKYGKSVAEMCLWRFILVISSGGSSFVSSLDESCTVGKTNTEIQQLKNVTKWTSWICFGWFGREL